MTPETAAPAPHARRWRGWLWLSLLANALLAWWLWRAQPPAPPPPATPVGESVLLRTPGGRLEISEIQQTESFEVSRDHDLLGGPVGSTNTFPTLSPAQNSLNMDLKNWFISGFNFGIISRGRAIVSSNWANPLFSANGGSFCGGTIKVQYVCSAPTNPNGGWSWGGGACYHRQRSIPC